MRQSAWLVFWAVLCVAAAVVIPSACRNELPPKTVPKPTDDSAGQTFPNVIAERTGRVLVVHSYHPEYAWCAEITRGLSRGWGGAALDVQYVYMDTKRNTEESWKRKAGREVLSRLETNRPDVVVLVDDDAQQYVGMSLVGTDLPVVFCGVNADPTVYGYPARNVTGFIERPPLEEGVAFLRRFRPCRRIAFLSNDDNTSRGALVYSKNAYFGESIVDWRLLETFSSWKRQILEYNETMDAVLLYTYHTLKDGEGRRVDPSEVMAWTRNEAKIPILGFFEFCVQDGAALGVVESGEEIGEKTADYVLRILSGVSPGDLPVTRNTHYRYMVNAETARRIGLECPPALLEGVEVMGGH